MVRNSMVWALPGEVSKSLSGLMESFTCTLGKLADSFPDKGSFPFGIVFSKKFFDRELFQNMNTRVPIEPILLLIHEFLKLSIH